MMLHADFKANDLRSVVEFAERLIPDNAWPVWTAGNHDEHRFPTRWCGNDADKTRVAIVMLMGLRGTPFVYYGDEIGMIDTNVPADRILDPVGKFHGPRFGRDDERTPMQWTNEPGVGFSEPNVEPWLPYGDYARYNVDDQRDDPNSMLALTRDLIALRGDLTDLARGSYETLLAPNDDVWLWKRGDSAFVACNFGPDAAALPGVTGTIRIATDRKRDGEVVDGMLDLASHSAVIISS
jgi:alpha-glucosidase